MSSCGPAQELSLRTTPLKLVQGPDSHKLSRMSRCDGLVNGLLSCKVEDCGVSGRAQDGSKDAVNASTLISPAKANAVSLVACTCWAQRYMKPAKNPRQKKNPILRLRVSMLSILFEHWNYIFWPAELLMRTESGLTHASFALSTVPSPDARNRTRNKNSI